MKTIGQLGEVRLIQRLRKQLGPGANTSSVLIGIGDDAAVLRWTTKAHLLFASDMLVEGVHFDRRLVSARWIGWKALACNVSDIAAMGGLPQWAVVSLGLPPATPVRFVDGLYAGLARCARRFGAAIVGGDTVRAPQVVIDVAILGTVQPGRLILRSGARVGDALFVTGRLGGSYRSGRHATFLPRLHEAQELLRRVPIHAMTDLSDGLASDLWQMSWVSRVALRVNADRVPAAKAARACPQRTCPCRRWDGGSATYHALMDGEDFELLFAVGRREVGRVPRRLGATPVTYIGTAMKRGVGVEMESSLGRIRPLAPKGFAHFSG